MNNAAGGVSSAPPAVKAAETIPHLVAACADWRGDHPVIVEENRRISYASLKAQMMRASAAFIKAGLQPGDRVAIWAHNGIDWVIAALGVQAAGGIIVPLNTRFKGQEAHYILDRSRARFLVHSTTFLGVSYGALIEGLDLPHLERLITIPTDEQRIADWDAFLASADADEEARTQAAERFRDLQPDAVSDILFTSGTTGKPKGVMTAHGQNVRTYREWVRATTLNENDRNAVIWPFFHCSGYKSGMLSVLIAGATIYPVAVFEPDRLVKLIVDEQITVLPGPPTLFQSLLASPEGLAGKLSSLRIAVTGATMVPPSLIQTIRDELGLNAILAGYGLTESCGTLTMTAPEDGPEVVARSPGRAIEGIEIAIIDADGAFVPQGTEGEIVSRGFNTMLGYFEDPEATREAIDEHGWLRTGDAGWVDQDGYVIITGRKKDIYIVAGFNCYPVEIEDMIGQHPAVAEVSVIGVPDERMGEVGMAFVVLSAGENLDEAGLISWGRERMANYKVPRFVKFVENLPKTPTGKVQKYLLKP